MADFPDARFPLVYEVEGVTVQYVNFANVPMFEGMGIAVPKTVPSIMDPVALVPEGSLISPETEPESQTGKFPITLTFLLTGSTPATW